MNTCKVVIETPGGSAQKYDYDEKNGLFELKKILPAGMMFPYDFGFVPNTKGEDGDPLDVIVISELTSFPGCVMKCRIIGCLEAEQSVEAGKKKMIRNDRYVGVPCVSRFFSKMDNLDEFPKKIVKELENFFITYNHMEGKEFRMLKVLQAKDAFAMLSKQGL